MSVAVENWAEQVRAGDVRAISRAVSAIENRDHEAEGLLRQLFPYTGRAYRVGITGAPGTGKSTLVDRLASHYRAEKKTVGIIAVDPSSGDIYAVTTLPPPGKVRRLLGTSFREAAVGVAGLGATAVALDAAHPSGSPVLYVVNAQDDTVTCLSATSLQTVATVAVGSRPRGIAVDEVRHTVYVTNWNAQTVSVFDGATFRRTGGVATGRGPHGIGLDTAGRLLYVTNTWENTMSTFRIE